MIIDVEGLFNGDRLRRCSNTAQLHWPRLLLASDGFARLEINYAKIIGRAYPTFRPTPSEQELQAIIQEYAQNSLLFLYEVDGQIWGQWDTRTELLPRYKTAQDRRSPIPPEPAFSDWKKRYRVERTVFPKSFGNISETFLHGVGVGVGVGVGKNTCASDDARGGDLLPSPDNPPFDTLFPPEKKNGHGKTSVPLNDPDRWFEEWWSIYWRKVAKKPARDAFRKHVKTATRFEQVMAATRAQSAGMLEKPADKRPHGATWLNGERWEDELDQPRQQTQHPSDDYPEFTQ